MKFLSSIVVFLISITLFSQGEANIWYFGENAGLNFNDCDPFAITDGELNTIEGCSSFSDANGNLLFYSDGSFVWNNEHNLMPNGVGLLGNPSSTQSAMIVPKPESSNIYYLFTVGDMSNPGFNYYIIDMNEDNGLGDVIEGPIELSENRQDWTEKVAAVKGAESGTYWVLSYVPNEFRAYKVTAQGVIHSPVQSPSFPANDAKGYLKISPDGKKVAIAHEGDSAFLLYDFNDNTGKVSNEILLPLITEGKNPYGVEFSTNGKKLYVHATDYVDIPSDGEDQEEPEYTATLFQFDISSGNESTIINSRTIIHVGNLYRGGLQLAPDKKIYRTLSRSYVEGIPLLGVIENPDESGTACNYNHASVGLLGNFGKARPPTIYRFYFLTNTNHRRE